MWQNDNSSMLHHLFMFLPTVEQLSIKEKKHTSLLDIEPKMEWSPREELKDVKIEPSDKPEQVEMFSGLQKSDLVEQLATKSQLVHDMISHLRKQVAEEDKQIAEKDEQIAKQAKQIAEKNELFVKYQQMYEELQKSKHGCSILTVCILLSMTRQFKSIIYTMHFRQWILITS